MSGQHTNYSNRAILIAILLVIAVTVAIIGGLQAIKHRQAQSSMRLNRSASAVMPVITHGIDTHTIDGFMLPQPKPLTAFSLMTTQNQPFGLAQLKGHWSMLFFGFTHCHYVCPTTLAALNQFYNDIQAQLPEAQWPMVVMITVDPERDTATRMQQYLNHFNAHFIGLHGSVQQTHQLADPLHISFHKVKESGDDYRMVHTANILIIDPQAKLRAYLSFPYNSMQMLGDYKQIINDMTPKTTHTTNTTNTTNTLKTIQSVQGHTFNQKDVSKSVLIINYWATWCESCMEEIQTLNQFYQRYKEQPTAQPKIQSKIQSEVTSQSEVQSQSVGQSKTPSVMVLGYNFDHLKPPALKALVKQYHIRYPLLLQNPQPWFQLPAVGILPTTFLIRPSRCKQSVVTRVKTGCVEMHQGPVSMKQLLNWIN